MVKNFKRKHKKYTAGKLFCLASKDQLTLYFGFSHNLPDKYYLLLEDHVRGEFTKIWDLTRQRHDQVNQYILDLSTEIC